MKQILLLFCYLSCSTWAFSGTERPPGGNHLTFFDANYHHVLTQIGADESVSNLYARDSEAPETWTMQFGVVHWPRINDFAQIVGPTVRDLRPQFVRDAQVFSPEGPRHDLETMVEVYLKSRQEGFLEYRLLRFVKEEGTPGVKLYLFSQRFSGRPEQGFPIDPNQRLARMGALAQVRLEVTREEPR